MPTALRVATFNCENLFSRPKIFAESAARSRTLLGYVADLQQALQNPVFDHPRIEDLKTKLRGYARVNDIRGRHQKAKGAGEWLGTVELGRGNFTEVTVMNTARVINDVDADVICLIEVEDRLTLQRFHDDILSKQFLRPANRPPYEHVLLIDGNDDRGIDVAVMARSQFPVQWLRSHIHERTTYMGRDVQLFSRDCLEVQVRAPNNRLVHLLVNHFKSMGYAPKTDPLSNQRRLAQARRVADLAGEHRLGKEYVIVAGDLNSDPTSASVAPLVQNPGLYNVNLGLPPAQRTTYRTGSQQLDYLFVSDALKARLQRVFIERRGLFTKKWPHYPQVTSLENQASDHAAVVAEFQL